MLSSTNQLLSADGLQLKLNTKGQRIQI